jgi:hypothetical protein
VAHIVVCVRDNFIESVITGRRAEKLNLQKGDSVAAVVKATEVMIQKDGRALLYLYDLERVHLSHPPCRSFFVRNDDPFFT